MENRTRKNAANDFENIGNIFLGILIGGLLGAAAMLLFAPQSGKETRDQIAEKSIELRDQTKDFVNDTIDQVKKGSNKFNDKMRDKFGQFKKHGREALDALEG